MWSRPFSMYAEQLFLNVIPKAQKKRCNPVSHSPDPQVAAIAAAGNDDECPRSHHAMLR